MPYVPGPLSTISLFSSFLKKYLYPTQPSLPDDRACSTCAAHHDGAFLLDCFFSGNVKQSRRPLSTRHFRSVLVSISSLFEFIYNLASITSSKSFEAPGVWGEWSQVSVTVGLAWRGTHNHQSYLPILLYFFLFSSQFLLFAFPIFFFSIVSSSTSARAPPHVPFIS